MHTHLRPLLVLGLLSLFSACQRAEPMQTPPTTLRWEVTELATNLQIPWDIAILPDGDLLVTERPGHVQRIAADGAKTLIADLSQVVSSGESGLTGIEIDPGFSGNNFVYLYYSYRDNGLKNRISRFTMKEHTLVGEKIIIDALPGGSIHNGGRMRFGPDGKLWILTGDAAQQEEAQSMDSLGGKILRVNADGSIPSDNPFPNSPVYSLGHRNPQGLDWNPITGELLVSEHGWNAHDEINIIKPGGNYAWPRAQRCTSDRSGDINPLLCSGTETWAPSGIAFLRTSDPELHGSFAIAGLRGSFLRLYALDAKGNTVLQKTLINDRGRLRAVTAGPDGSLYVSTSNRDGRGIVRNGDDKILLVRPVRN